MKTLEYFKGKLIDNDGRALAELLKNEIIPGSMKHAGDFIFTANTPDGGKLSVLTVPADEEYEKIKIEDITVFAPTTKCVNGDIQKSDLVISTPGDEYGCLIGRVMQINLLGSPEHEMETENETDDVHVDFLEFEYSEQRIKKIEEAFSDLYGEKKSFNECPLDDTIMCPDSLIRITGISEDRLNRLLQSEYAAACYCFDVVKDINNELAQAPAEQNNGMTMS